MKISIVIPVHNEVENLNALHEEILEVVNRQNYDAEILFIDDGSTDESWSIVSELAGKHEHVKAIKFRRNFGKAAALDAGFAQASGEICITMDGDLQDDPAEIPRFLEKLDEDYDVVSGWKRVRHDPWHKVLPSRIFNFLVSTVTGVKLNDHNCGFKCYRTEALNGLTLYGELHRFIPVLTAAKGWKVGQIEVNHRARQHGRSKYGLSRIPKGFLDLLTVKFLTGYDQRPLHLLGMFGLLSLGAGSVILLFLTLGWCLSRVIGNWEPIHLHERALFYYSLVGMVLGAQFLSVGFLAELINARERKTAYSVQDKLNCNEKKS